MIKLIKSIAYPWVRKYVVMSEKRAYRNADIDNLELTNNAVRDIIRTATPASIGKMGATELAIVLRYLEKIPVDSKQWKHRMNRLHVWSGIFPENTELMYEYCETFLEAVSEIDVLGVWFNKGEAGIARKYCKNTRVGNYNGLEPFSCENPWTRELAGKNVLVIHPFLESIKSQYEKHDLIWGERKLLPDFNLLQIQMPLSDALVPSKFNNWKEQVDDIKRQMDALDYDVALVGAGAYSLLLTQHAKQRGKIGIHLGGATQILFGIYGARWLENDEAKKLFNEHWVRPLPEETPDTSKLVEDGCYW